MTGWKPSPRRRAAVALVAILTVAATVRIYLIVTTGIVSRDSITFIRYAKGLETDPLGEMRRQAQHPLYPAAILGTHKLIGHLLDPDPVFSWVRAAQIAALLGGLPVVGAAFVLGRALWNIRTGLATALFAGVLPELCHVSADALSDGLHLSLYLWGLVAVIVARQTSRLRWLAVAALLSGLAFLTRPEGGSILVVGLSFVVAARGWRGWTWRQRLTGVTIMGLCFVVSAGPYMLVTGRVIKKKNVFEMFGLDDRQARAPESSGTDGPMRAALMDRTGAVVMNHWVRACRVVYFLLALPAVLTRLIPRPRTWGPLVVALLLQVVLLFALHRTYGYVSLRHALVPAVLTLPWAAATFVWLIDHVSAWYAFHHDRRVRRVRPVACLVGGLIVIGPTVPWLIRPIGGGSRFLMTAGRWLHDHSRPGEVVLAGCTRTAYFSGLPMVPWATFDSVDDLRNQINTHKPKYVVIDLSRVVSEDRNPRFLDQLQASDLRNRLAVIHREVNPIEGLRGTILIYRVVGPAPCETVRSDLPLQ